MRDRGWEAQRARWALAMGGAWAALRALAAAVRVPRVYLLEGRR